MHCLECKVWDEGIATTAQLRLVIHSLGPVYETSIAQHWLGMNSQIVICNNGCIYDTESPVNIHIQIYISTRASAMQEVTCSLSPVRNRVL